MIERAYQERCRPTRPVFITKEDKDGERVSVSQFCNDACLHAYIEAEELVYGASYELDRK